MSRELARFRGSFQRFYSLLNQTINEDAEMFVTSFWGGTDRGSCVQITVNEITGNSAYIQLSKASVGRLISILQEWNNSNSR